MATLQQELEELINVKNLIESSEFQKFFVAPMREKQNELRVSFFSDSLKDAWRKGGRMEGLKEFFEILKQIDVDYRNKKDEFEG